MEEFCYGKGYQVLVWENFGLVTVIRFWYGSKGYQVLVWKNFVMVTVIRFWYGRIFGW